MKPLWAGWTSALWGWGYEEALQGLGQQLYLAPGPSLLPMEIPAGWAVAAVHLPARSRLERPHPARPGEPAPTGRPPP